MKALKKCYVCYISKDNLDIEIVKCRIVRDGYIIDKKNKRLIIVTTKPMHYKGKQIYFVKETDIHTFNPNTGDIIEEPIKTFALKLHEKKKLEEIGETSEFGEIKDLSPHELTEEVISYLVDNKIIANLIQSVQTTNWLNNLMWLAIGILAGVVIGTYAPAPQ